MRNVLAVLASLLYLSGAHAQDNVRVSQGASGAQSSALAASGVLSGDGTIAGFTSSGTEFVATDANSERDMFLKNRLTGAVTIGNLLANGGQVDSESFGEFISRTAKFLTFRTGDFTTVPGPGDQKVHCYLKNLTTGELLGIDKLTDGTFANDDCDSSSVTDDGKIVLFASQGSNLEGGGFPDRSHVYQRNLKTGVTTLVSKRTDGTAANETSGSPRMSFDGRYVVFTSVATNLADTDSNIASDIFLRDVKKNRTTIISNGVGGVPSNGPSRRPSISRDGKLIVFESDATNLVPSDTNGSSDCFLHVVKTGVTTKISSTPEGETGAFKCTFPVVSGDGNRIALVLTSLMGGLDNVYVYAVNGAVLRRITFDLSLGEPDDGCSKPAISTDGRVVLWESAATDLVSNDTNNVHDQFLTTHLYNLPLTEKIRPARAVVEPSTKKGRAPMFFEYFTGAKYTLLLKQVGSSTVRTQKTTKTALEVKGLAKGEWTASYTVKATVDGSIVKSKPSKPTTFTVK